MEIKQDGGCFRAETSSKATNCGSGRMAARGWREDREGPSPAWEGGANLDEEAGTERGTSTRQKNNSGKEPDSL